MSETSEILARLPVFAGVPAEALEAVATRTVPRSLSTNRRLFLVGEACRGLHVVTEGNVIVYRAGPDGREQVLHSHGPATTVAELPLFDGGAYPASARATEPSRLLFLPREEFTRLYRMHPEIADAVIQHLGRRLRRMVGLVDKLSLKDVPTRVAITLLEHAGGTPGAGPRVEFDLGRSQEALAAELGTTRESVARAFSRLRREGIIHQKGVRIQVRDLARLETVAAGRRRS